MNARQKETNPSDGEESPLVDTLGPKVRKKAFRVPSRRTGLEERKELETEISPWPPEVSRT